MIDFHCHLDLYPEPYSVARQCIERNMYVLSVTTTPSAWKGTSTLAASTPRIRTALGLHPQLAHERRGELDLFDHLLPQVTYVGEIGLDGGKEYAHYWPDQLAVFDHILASCAQAGGRILSLHSRHAASQVLERLGVHRDAGTAVLHWFSGTSRELQRAAEFGCWFSVGPAMLASSKGRSLAAQMPRDRVLTESDGPFAQIELRAAWPWEVIHAIESLSEIWREPVDVVNLRLKDNLNRLVRSLSHESGA